MKPRMTDVVLPPTFEQTAGFTPGPWKYIPSHIAEGPSEVRHADGWLICCTCSDEFARLIAAGPDLYSAASKLIAAFDELQSMTTAERIITGRSDAAIRKASNEALAELRAAIAAAKGGA